MPALGESFNLPFSVLTPSGGDYTNDSAPPSVVVVQADLTHAPSVNTAVRIVGGLWGLVVAASEVVTTMITFSWSGSGILSGSKTLLISGLTGEQASQLAEILNVPRKGQTNVWTNVGHTADSDTVAIS